MRLATIRTGTGTRAVRIDGERAVETGHADLGVLLGAANWREQAAATGARARSWRRPARSSPLVVTY